MRVDFHLAPAFVPERGIPNGRYVQLTLWVGTGHRSPFAQFLLNLLAYPLVLAVLERLFRVCGSIWLRLTDCWKDNQNCNWFMSECVGGSHWGPRNVAQFYQDVTHETRQFGLDPKLQVRNTNCQHTVGVITKLN